MSDDRADLILNLLRAIRAKLDEHDLKFEEVITRLGRLERESVNTRSEIVTVLVCHVRLRTFAIVCS